MENATSALVWGTVGHLIADWLLQNSWMAKNKRNPCHLAAWVHSGIYILLMLPAFDWYVALALGLVHLLIDTGRPMAWWFRVFKRMNNGPTLACVKIWTDQALHVLLIALAALIFNPPPLF